jgi:hypothetical protein
VSDGRDVNGRACQFAHEKLRYWRAGPSYSIFSFKLEGAVPSVSSPESCSESCSLGRGHPISPC